MARTIWPSFCALLAGAALLAAAFVHHAGAGSAAGEVKQGGTLRLGRFTDVDSIDPALAYSPFSWVLEFSTCAKLFNFPDAEGSAGTRVMPEVVDRYTVSRDGRTYTFDLKRTFRFDTGAPVTASSFVDAFNRNANPKMQSPAVALMGDLVGLDAVSSGRAAKLSGVRVLGRYRLQIRLTRPVGDFTARLTAPLFCPVGPNTPIDPAGIDDPAGSGPYYVAERVVNRRVVLRRNPFYRGDRPANVDQIVFSVTESRDACRAAVDQDQMDVCLSTNFGDAAYRQIVDAYGINRRGGRFFVRPSLTTWFFALNHDRPAFKGPGQIPLKKAINYAIDRPALARAFGYLRGRRTDHILPPALGRNRSVYPIRGADTVSARRWLARARLKPAKLVLYVGANVTGVALAELLAFDLKQIGIDLDIKYYDAVTLDRRAGTRGEPFDIASKGWAADYPDGAAFLERLLHGKGIASSGNANESYFDDAKTNARIDGANRLAGEPRRAAWADLDADLMRTNPPWAPYVHENERTFISKSFGCFLFHPVYGVDVAAACQK
jgi:ABC-type oligopeptide transport system substrate-binding subunit